MNERIKNAMEAIQNENERFCLSPHLRKRILASVKEAKRDEFPSARVSKTRWLLAAVLVFVIATGFASIRWYEIRNKEGQTVMEYQAAPPLSKEQLADAQQRQDEYDMIQNKLEPGTAAAVYRLKDDGQEDFYFTARPLTISEFEQVGKYTKDVIDYPKQLAETYSFVEASLGYEYEKDESLHGRLQKKARESGEKLIIHPIEATQAISYVSATYQDASGNILHINLLKQFWDGKSKMIVPGSNQTVEEIHVGKQEGLYIERLDPFGKPRKEIRWMEEGWSRSINSTDATITKEQLLKIASQLH